MGQCVATNQRPLLNVYNAMLVAVLPTITLLPSNVVFTRTLLQRSKKRAGRSTCDGAEQARTGERNYLVMMLVTSCAYLMFLLFSLAMNDIAVRYATSDPNLADLLLDLQAVTVVMNNSFNFCFYYFSGPMFRKAYAKAFGRNKKPDQKT